METGKAQEDVTPYRVCVLCRLPWNIPDEAHQAVLMLAVSPSLQKAEIGGSLGSRPACHTEKLYLEQNRIKQTPPPHLPPPVEVKERLPELRSLKASRHPPGSKGSQGSVETGNTQQGLKIEQVSLGVNYEWQRLLRTGGRGQPGHGLTFRASKRSGPLLRLWGNS